MTFKEVVEQAEFAKATLRADDPRFNQSILLITLDSVHIIDNAFLFNYGEAIAVFAEHHPLMVLHKEEVCTAIEYKVVRVLKDDRKV